MEASKYYVSVRLLVHTCMFEYLSGRHFPATPRSLLCVSLPFSASNMDCSVAHLAHSGPRLSGNSSELCAISPVYVCVCSSLLLPCMCCQASVNEEVQGSMQDGGIEGFRQAQAKGGGREAEGVGVCTVTESIKDEERPWQES